MEEYLIGLGFLALAIFSLSMIQLQISRNRALQRDRQRILSDARKLQVQLRDREEELDLLARSSNQLLKWRNRAVELEGELRTAKSAEGYLSARRLRSLEEYISCQGSDPSVMFLSTFSPQGRRSFEHQLHRMLERAEFEIIIASPWIKRQTWAGIKSHLTRLSRKGGRLCVLTRGSESDYSIGMSDDVSREVIDLGGEIVPLPQLHAKVYLVDRKEAIIASANLTRGGVEDNYEAGVWLNDPVVIKEICDFLEALQGAREKR